MAALILVPLDGSPFSEQALPLALAIARGRGATVELVHVHEAWLPPTDATARDVHVEQERRTEMERWLTNLTARMERECGQPIGSAFLDDAVGPALAAHVSRRRPDLVVMATHGRGGLSRAWLGSITDWLVRHVTVPLLLVRPTADTGAPAGGLRLHRVLVPLAGSTLAESALGPATALGTPGKTEYLLMTAVAPAGLTTVDAAIALESVGPTRERAAEVDTLRRGAAAYYLGRVAEDLRGRGFTVATHVSVHPHQGRAILDYASEIGADLIALATQGHGGLVRLLLGSVADKVVRGATVPVLVVPPAAVPAKGASHART